MGTQQGVRIRAGEMRNSGGEGGEPLTVSAATRRGAFRQRHPEGMFLLFFSIPLSLPCSLRCRLASPKALLLRLVCARLHAAVGAVLVALQQRQFLSVEPSPEVLDGLYSGQAQVAAHAESERSSPARDGPEALLAVGVFGEVGGTLPDDVAPAVDEHAPELASLVESPVGVVRTENEEEGEAAGEHACGMIEGRGGRGMGLVGV